MRGLMDTHTFLWWNEQNPKVNVQCLKFRLPSISNLFSLVESALPPAKADTLQNAPSSVIMSVVKQRCRTCALQADTPETLY